MFKIGNKVRWQTRNKNATGRFASAFHLYKGQVVAIDADAKKPTLTVEYLTPNPNGGTNTHQMLMRQLRNGNWIAKHEDKDDPKGRLYLALTE